jgi:hypothetical protein
MLKTMAHMTADDHGQDGCSKLEIRESKENFDRYLQYDGEQPG